ncbi:MAG: protein kinase domain-containing protein, partial [Polyangiaceae bacterium]
IGTPQYMSPEQAQALETVDHRTDVFSLGAVLFEAIAGQPYMPERPTYEQTILQLVSTKPPRLSTVVPGIPAALDDLVADMLEHDPERRVQSMRIVRERLEGIYPQLSGSAVKLKSLPPASSPALERYVVHGSGAPHEATVSGTSAAIVVPRSRRPLLYVAALAVAVGVTVGVGATRGSKSGRSLPPSPPAVDAVHATIPPIPPAPQPSAERLAEPSAGSAAAPPPSAAASGVAPATTAGTAPFPQGTRKPAPAAHPKDQVGAAGISSQF